MKTSIFHRQGIEILKLSHHMDSSLIPLEIINALLTAVVPYISIFLSAAIIDSLLGKEFRLSITYAAILVGSQFIVGILVQILERATSLRERRLQRRVQMQIRRKAMDLDYETMSDAKSLEMIRVTERTMSMYGGPEEVVRCYKIFLTSILSILTAIALVLQFCFSVTHTGSKILAAVASAPVTLAALILVVVAINIASWKFVHRYDEIEAEVFESHTDKELQLEYILNNVLFNAGVGSVIRLFDMKAMVLEQVGKLVGSFQDFFGTMCSNDTKKSLSQNIIAGIFTLFSYGIVILKIVAGAISIGSLTKYAGALNQFSLAFGQIIFVNREIERKCSYLEGYLKFLKLENRRETGSIPVEKRRDNEYEIEFHNVSFIYPGTESKSLNRVNCKLTLKDKMAVVGKNGAGKTTFIKLLIRLYDPTEGYITLNGVDIKKYNYEDYLSLFGVVFQDFHMFAFPVGENIAASEAVDADQVWECLDKAGAKELVETMSRQLKTPLFKFDEEGTEVSGGQAQKLAIARALYKDAPFVILDEPTAALDPISEYEIYARFNEMVENKTSIYISHRMSSCRFCNDIIVFDEGEIKERGSHDVLMKKNLLYAKMWNAQAQYYR